MSRDGSPHGRGVVSASQRLPILLLTENPALNGLTGPLWAQGLEPVRVATTEEAQTLLAMYRGRCIALLDAYRPAHYSFGAVYQLLHGSPPVPTLLVLSGPNGAPAEPAQNAPPTDDRIVLPMDLPEIAQRARALAEGAGLPLPAVVAAAVAAMAPRHVPLRSEVASGEHTAPTPATRPRATASAGTVAAGNGSIATPAAVEARSVADANGPATADPESHPTAAARRRGRLLLGGLLLLLLVVGGLVTISLGGTPQGGTAQDAPGSERGAGPATSLLTDCEAEMAAARWESAVAVCTRAREASPGDPRLAEALAAAYVGVGRQQLAQEGQVTGALAQFQQALAVEPDQREGTRGDAAGHQLPGGRDRAGRPGLADRCAEVRASVQQRAQLPGERRRPERLRNCTPPRWAGARHCARRRATRRPRRHCGRALDLVSRGAEAEACLAAVNAAQPPTPFPTVAPRPTRFPGTERCC